MISRIVLAIALACSFLGAQESAPTEKKLEKFDQLIGNWHGVGNAKIAPDAPEVAWKSHATYKKVLGDHFIQEDVKVEFDGDMIPTLYFRNYYGWHTEQKKYVVYEVSNTGEMVIYDNVGWTDKNEFVMSQSTVTDRGPLIQRTVLEVDEDRFKYRMENAIGANDFTIAVQGTMMRGGDGYQLKKEDLANGLAPAPHPMEKVRGMCGKYAMKGKAIMDVGAPAFEFSGRESVEPLFGGHFYRMHIGGDPTPEFPAYEGEAYFAWDPKNGCYQEFWLNNLGQCGFQHLYSNDQNQLIIVLSGRERGKPKAERSVLQFDETGAIVKFVMHRLSGNHEPDISFEGEYTKIEKATEKEERSL